jgi:hypothetical protein
LGNRALKIYNIPFGGENVRAQSAPHVPLYKWRHWKTNYFVEISV